MDAILKYLIGSHLFLIFAIHAFSGGPEGLILLPISVLWLGFELCLITGLINQLLLKDTKKGSVHLWGIVFLTVFILYEQMTSSPAAF